MKKILSLLLIALLIVNLAACGSKKGTPVQEESAKEETADKTTKEEEKDAEEEDEDLSLSIPQRITKSCVEAMFVPDMREVYALIHPKLMEYSKAQLNLTEEQYGIMIDTYNASMLSSIDDLNKLSENWKIKVEFLSQVPLAETQLATLKRVYSLADLTLSGGTLLNVRIHAVVDGETIPLQDSTFCCVQVLGRWYLDTVLTELIPKEETADTEETLPTA